MLQIFIIYKIYDHIIENIWYIYINRKAGQWFSPGIPDSSTNKTDHHDITEILLKVVLNIITLTLNPWIGSKFKDYYFNCGR